MKRFTPRLRRSDDPHQLQIAWSQSDGSGPPVAASLSGTFQTGALLPAPKPVSSLPIAALVQRLPWDFTTTFPQPTDEAIDAGVLHEDDREPENLKALHDDYSRQCVAALREIDSVADAHRRGIDPGTGKPPRTHAARERLRTFLEEEPERLERGFRILIETYENAFGIEAASAFAKCIRARHAGIPVVADTEAVLMPVPTPRSKHVSAPLPVPKALPAAIAAGHFGRANGEPVTPTPEEVRAITEHHAEKIIDLMSGLREVERWLAGHCGDRARVGAEVARLTAEIKFAIDKYAASFGTEAGERLEGYTRRQVVVRSGSKSR